MKYIIVIIIIIVILLLCNKSTEEGFRSNKCFSCEKDIPYLDNPNMAFTSKCYDCEKPFNDKFEMYDRNIRAV